MSKLEKVGAVFAIVALLIYVAIGYWIFSGKSTEDKPSVATSRYGVTLADGKAFSLSQKDGSYVYRSIYENTGSSRESLRVVGDLVGTIEFTRPSRVDGVTKVVARGKLYAYRGEVIYVSDYAVDHSYRYAKITGKRATRVLEMLNSSKE